MDKLKNMTIEEKVNQMKEDYNNEWWKPSRIDNFDIQNKVKNILSSY